MVSPFFNNFTYTPTQEMYQDIIVQAISIYGHEVVYIPRNVTNFDELYDTDDQSTYSVTIPIDGYIENIDGFQGQRDIFTKFGLEIRDSVTMVFAKRTYDRVIAPITKQPRPMEGDLIYFTANQKVFQIHYVNNKEIFYAFGTLPTYQMELNLFEYSDETFNTGIPEIDSIQNSLSLNAMDHEITLPDGTGLTDTSNNLIVTPNLSEQNVDAIADNKELEIEDASFIDFSTKNPFGGISQ